MILNVEKVESFFLALKPWHKHIFSFILGAVAAAAMPPLGMFFLLPASISLFIIIARSFDKRKSAFINGWMYGCGYFIFGFYWISYALFVDIQLWWWVLPLSLIVGPAIYALYYAFIPLFAFRYRKHDILYPLAICVAMAAVEWIRGHAFTGFPWNLTGYAWSKILPIQQTNSYIGIYGLTLLTILWSAIPAFRCNKVKTLLIVSFFIALLGGLYRLNTTKLETYNDVAVRVVQPNIKQTDKWEPEQKYVNFRKLLLITKEEGKDKLPVKFVVWPESATVLDLDSSSDMLDITASALPKDSFGIIGSLNVKMTAKDKDPQFFNSITFISSTKKLVDIYNKTHLVPFGEYIPYRKYINLTPIAAGVSAIGDFERGDGLHTIKLGANLPSMSPLICYEVIFPSEVARKGNERPDWLVNVTNDAWYGVSAGPYQHFEITRTRAIEEGLPLIRSANTGISGAIDPLGNVLKKMPLNESGAFDVMLSKPLPATLYSRYGDSLFFIMITTLLLITEAGYIIRKSKK